MINTTTIQKEIHGSGKAPFPGEKKITDESPRMEEEDDDFDINNLNESKEFKFDEQIENDDKLRLVIKDSNYD